MVEEQVDDKISSSPDESMADIQRMAHVEDKANQKLRDLINGLQRNCE